jgi:hypothetical protein
MLLDKVSGEKVFFERVNDKIRLVIENPAPTTTFFKGKGKIEVRADVLTIDIPIDFATYLYTNLKIAEDNLDDFIENFFHTTEENGEEKRITVFKGKDKREGQIGIKIVNYTKKEGGVIWVYPRSKKLIQILVALKIALKEYPLLLYKEQDLNIVWNREGDKKLVITKEGSGEWTQLFNEISIEIFREAVSFFDKTGEVPNINFVPAEEPLLKIEGSFFILGKEYPLATFKRIGYLMDI